MTEDSSLNKVGFFAPYTEHVGTEGAILKIASHFENAGCAVDLLRTHREWPDQPDRPGRVVSLDCGLSRLLVDRLPSPGKKLGLTGVALRGVTDYLERDDPDVLVVGLLSAVGASARLLADTDAKVLITMQGLPQNDWMRRQLWPRTYPTADALVAPATGVKERAKEILGDSAAEVPIEVIPNPVVNDELIRRGQEQPDHPWFDDEIPVIVAVGRQTWQKDFETLLRAFADLRESRNVRLIVPGKESEKTFDLQQLQRELGISNYVDFPGFVDNPYAYMAAAEVFVLSSRFEGPGHVLIEALAVGTPAVSTDCPAGPREILDGGSAGMLVPVGEPEQMADAIEQLLSNPSLRERYVTRGKDAIDPYRVENACERYLELCRDLADNGN